MVAVRRQAIYLYQGEDGETAEYYHCWGEIHTAKVLAEKMRVYVLVCARVRPRACVLACVHMCACRFVHISNWHLWEKAV